MAESQQRRGYYEFSLVHFKGITAADFSSCKACHIELIISKLVLKLVVSFESKSVPILFFNAKEILKLDILTFKTWK